jgi:integrase
VTAATGARSGELFALRWSDVTFDGRPHISIRQSLSRAKGPHDAKTTWRFGRPKTKSGLRDIPIDPATVLALKKWKVQSERNEYDLVFPHPSGEPLDRSIMSRCGFWPALKRAGLRPVKFHSLRHSYASGLIAHGAVLTEVAARLGHSNPGLTLKIYSHWFKGADSGASDAYAASLFGAVDTK